MKAVVHWAFGHCACPHGRSGTRSWPSRSKVLDSAPNRDDALRRLQGLVDCSSKSQFVCVFDRRKLLATSLEMKSATCRQCHVLMTKLTRRRMARMPVAALEYCGQTAGSSGESRDTGQTLQKICPLVDSPLWPDRCQFQVSAETVAHAAFKGLAIKFLSP